MVLKLKDGRKELYQWDVGVVVDVTDENINEVHFSNLRYGVSFNIEVQNGTVTIPPEVLQSGADVFCWAFVRGENGGYTKKEQIFNVEKRPRPADYVYTPTEVLTWEALKKQIEGVEAELLADIGGKADRTEVETALSGKVNKSDILTRVASDEVYNDNQFYNANAVNSLVTIFDEDFVMKDTFNTIIGEVDNTLQTKVNKIDVLSNIDKYAQPEDIYNAPAINAVLLTLQDTVRSLDERLTVIDGGINEISALVGGA